VPKTNVTGLIHGEIVSAVQATISTPVQLYQNWSEPIYLTMT